MLEVIFWLLVALGLYSYVGYPVLVALLGRLWPVKTATSASSPSVTVVISAYNEAKHIEATVRNKLNQQYPEALLNILVVSDSSADGTDAIVQALAASSSRVKFLRNEPRQGKTAALNLALSTVTNDIVVFSDANSIYRPDVIANLTRNFADKRVGYVTGRMLYVNEDGSLVGDGCSAYMKYENALRAAETRMGSVVGVDGGVDAIRRPLYRPMRADQLPDFVLPLTVVEQGYRVVYEPDAVLTEESLSEQADEYRMRVRVALRAFWALWDKRGLLNPFRYGVFAWQLWSHKVLRYLSFIPLVLAMIVNWYLLPQGAIYTAALVVQALFFAFALAGALNWFGGLAPVRYCFYFFLLNWASAVAFARFLRGQKQVLWQPRTG